MNDFDLSLALVFESSFTNDKENTKNKYENDKMSLVDPIWESIDPIPDVYAMFQAYDKRFFQGKLASVELRWSPRMYTCAGICVYQGRFGMCSIRLSEALLKFRPRKDLVETLLHEMIHAFLFLTNNDRDRDGHGPKFQYHMGRINQEAGTKISIYHSFHDEVNNYKVHWWRCEGPCKDRHPFYGWVKRTMNRAPGPKDLWWAQHKATCNGEFIKVKEPENFKARKKNDKPKQPKKSVKTSSTPQLDIRPFFSQNGNNKAVFFSSDEESQSSASIASSSRNSLTQPGSTSFVPFSGTGVRLGGGSSSPTQQVIVKPPPRKRKLSDKHVINGSSPSSPKTSPLAQVDIRKFFTPRSTAKIASAVIFGSDDEEEVQIIVNPSTSSEAVLATTQETVSCPSCSIKLPMSEINSHLDRCLS